MKRCVEWLLDLKDIRLGDSPLSLQWDLPVAPWILLAIVLVAGAATLAVYGQERLSWPRRASLGAVRLFLIGLVLAAACRPSLILQQNRVEPAYVSLLVDTSSSMGLAERYTDAGLAETLVRGAGLDDPDALARTSRLELAVRALLKDQSRPLSAMLQQNGLQLTTFSASPETIAITEKGGSPEALAGGLRAIEADGAATDLAAALQQLLRRTQGRRLAAIVLVSDGQVTSSVDLEETLSVAADKQVPVFPLRLGSTRPLADLEVASVRAQSSVFAHDVLLVEATVSERGLQANPGAGAQRCTLQLIDRRSGEIVDQKEIELNESEPSKRVELSVRPTRPGEARYEIRVAALPDERNVENNSDAVDVTVLEDRLKILYVEEYPRYEYRFLKNALLREKTVDLNVLLLEADEQFVQEGTDPIRRFPETPEELNQYHVVIFGDVNPQEGWLMPAQMTLLLDYVGNTGGGFALIAGERHAPHSYMGTPLERLIPVSIDPQPGASPEAALHDGFQPEWTAEGRESRIFRFLADREANEGLFESLPELFWCSRTLGPKPGASVLLEHPELRSASGPMPLVALGRYGAGKIFFQATDDTWRWRRETGELVYDGYWVRVVRELMNPASKDRRYVLRTDRRLYEYSAPVRTQVELVDPHLADMAHGTVTLRVSSETQAEGDPPALDLPVGEFPVHRLGEHSNLFEGSYVPPRPGRYSISPVDLPPLSSGRVPSVVIRVAPPDLEARRPEADHERLQRIATATGGRLLDLDFLAESLGEIRDRSIQIPDDVKESLWDSKLFFLLFVLMISMEWVFRKVFGLL